MASGLPDCIRRQPRATALADNRYFMLAVRTNQKNRSQADPQPHYALDEPHLLSKPFNSVPNPYTPLMGAGLGGGLFFRRSNRLRRLFDEFRRLLVRLRQ